MAHTWLISSRKSQKVRGTKTGVLTIARRWKISEGSVRQKLMMAESFIDGCLAMSGATLEMDAWAHKSEKFSTA
ncbi:hypothetical protein JY493_01670 [Serratia marcescens]|nr:hypothetical protein [Serratia marcescens]